MKHGAPAVRLVCAILCISAACALDIHSEDDWAGPMDAHAQQQLTVRSRQSQHSTRSVAQRYHRAGARRLLTPSRQSQLTATGRGILTYQPIGYSIDGADFTQFILEAHSNTNVTGVRLGSESYHVYAKAEDAFHIYITCSSTRNAPFEVDFTGAFFYFTDHRFGGVKIDTCSNIHLHGPYEQTWTNDELPFTQGKILAMDTSSDPAMATAQVDDGYPSDRIMLHEVMQVLAFANDTRLMRNVPCPDIWTPSDTSNRKKLSSNQYQFPFRPGSITGCAGEPGDLFVARSTTGAKALQVDTCSHTTVADISIYSSGGFAMFQTSGTNNTFMRIQVRPFPRPLGNDGALPLLASVADGFHAVDSHRGTIFRDNFIVNTGDDGIAMHGEYYAVADSDPRRQTVVIASSSSFPFDRNDSLTFYAPDTQCWGTGVIDDLYSVNQPSATSGKQNKALSANSNNQYNYDDCDFMQVKFKHWPEGFNNVKYGDILSSPSANGNGFAILNNTIGNLRGRGMIIKSSDGIIADNTLFNLPYTALQLAPEQQWQEADFVHNVLVANNVINSNGSGIWLGINPGSGGPPLYTNNYAVDFVGNTIVNSQTGPFTVTSAAQVTIANTTFVNVLCTTNNTQAFDWATPGSLIMLANVDNVAFWGNEVVKTAACVNPQGNYKDPVSMVNSTNVQGLAPPASSQAATVTLLQRDSAP